MKDTSEITRSVLERRDEWRKERMRRRNRTLTKCMAVLLAVALLGGGVLAAGGAGEWFTDFFASKTEAGLSESQERFIQTSAVYPSVTSVSGGYALTIDYALSDGLDYYFLMTLTGPEDRELLRHEYLIELACLYPTGGGTSEGDGRFCGTQILCTETAELPANSVRLLLHMQMFNAEVLNGRDLSLHMRNFEVINDQCETVEWITGPWHFDDLTFVSMEQPVELLDEPFVTAGRASYSGETCDVRIDSVQLRPFSMVMEYSRLEWSASPLLEAQIVMKDGSSVSFGFSSSGGPDGGTLDHSFDVPLILSEVDHVLLSNGMKLEMP